MSSEVESLTQRYMDGTITSQELRHLNVILEKEAEARRRFTELMNVDSAIAAIAAGWEVEPNVDLKQDLSGVPAHGVTPWHYWLAAIATGLLIGILGTQTASAFVSPVAVATVEQVTSLIDPGFEKLSGRIPAGFPQVSGVWSGDEAEVIPVFETRAGKRTHVLRFVRPGADLGNRNGLALSCDVFQMVDLRPLRASLQERGDAVLEFSADFLDGRQESSTSITFICQVFQFSGSAEALHKVWPRNLASTIGSGAALLDSSGEAQTHWKTLTARCLLNPEADFAVVQLGARPNGADRVLSEQYVDRVQLSLKVQPLLPIRQAKR